MKMPPSVLVGLIGSGIQKSRTPLMHEREGARHGLRYIYKLIDLDVRAIGPDALPELLRNAERLGYDGFNITHPCKQAVMEHLDSLSDDAREIGAVNTVVLRGGRRAGHNTDWYGFRRGLEEQLPDVPMDRVVQLGAGGAGSATAYALMKMGVGKLTLCDRSGVRAGALAAHLCGLFGEGRVVAAADPIAAVADAQGVVQATFVGMASHPGTPIPKMALRPEHWFAEIIYFPMETELLAHARSIGCRTADGAGMALYQAVRAFELFSGVTPDAEAMRRDFFAMGA